MADTTKDPFGALKTIDLPEGATSFYRLGRLEEEGIVDSLDRLPFSIRILLENALRHAGGGYVTEDHVRAVTEWSPTNAGADLPFMPTRVVLQDFTGVPAVVDLAAMRDGLRELGGDPSRINPVVPADLVIDHSVQVDYFGFGDAFRLNVEKEFERNRERYALLRWAQEAFDNFSVVPPGTGIVHQVNLEYLASVIHRRSHDGTFLAYPDTLVGTDSHTTMVNGLGVVGWGVGGIEAEAVVLGQPYYMLLPEVVGMKLTGVLPEGATATDLVLRVTEMLRAHGVVGRFVEYYGAGLSNLSLPDKATLANMAPEYGATIGFFPVDDSTLAYLRGTGRDEGLVARVEAVSKELGLFRTDETPDPGFTSTLDLDLSTVEPSLAGPKRPQDRIRLADMRKQFEHDLPALIPSGFVPAPAPGDDNGGVAVAERTAVAVHDGREVEISDGTVVIASITSCTNTSNPSVMVGAGLLAKKAVEKGLEVKPWVKTALAPGSQVVTDYLTQSGLLPYLEELRFHVVGYGCMTCIGNSGPPARRHPPGDRRERTRRRVGALRQPQLRGRGSSPDSSGPTTSPRRPLVVAYALAGHGGYRSVPAQPLGQGSVTASRCLPGKDIWPSPQEEIQKTIEPVRSTLRAVHRSSTPTS